MAEIIRMPRMSDTMTEGNIVEWHKKVGDQVEPGDILADVETDKATMELESYFEGTLLHIGVESGTVEIDAVLAIIGEEGEDWQSALKEAEAQDLKDQSVSKELEPEKENLDSSDHSMSPQSTSSSTDQRLKASPLARKIAEEKGIDLGKLSGSGTEGRIIKKDVESYQPVEMNVTNASATTVHALGEGDYEDLPVSQMRKVIARRLSESKFSAPHFYLTISVNMDRAVSTRANINESIAPDKISYNDLIVKAVASALRKHPMVNASWMGDTIRVNNDINIGVAVAVEDGLLVPVVKHANTKSLREINSEVRELASKAKEKRLNPTQMSGNSFTISNLGMYGIEEFTAIINPPDACILAVGGIIKKPVVKDGKIVVGSEMKLCLSCDHRVVDGAMGAEFLNTLKSMLENPVQIIV